MHDMGFWMYPERIFSGCTVLVAVRNNETPDDLKSDIDSYRERYCAKIELLRTSDIEISSSMIREYVSEGRSVRYYLPEKLL